MQTIYRPGQWYLIVIPGALVALPPDVPGDVVARLWERMPEEKTLATVVDVLTAHAGGSFTSLPSFVAAVAEGADVRIALRGAVSAQVATPTDSFELSGAEVTTWNERFLGGASKIEITVEAPTDADGLPVQSGIVRAAAVSAELEPSDADPLTSVLGPSPVVGAVLSEPGLPEAVAAEPVVSEPEAEPEPAPEPEPALEPVVPEPEAEEPLPLIEDAFLPPTEVTLAPPVDDDFDQLWGATVHSVGGAAPVVPVPVEGDHDGATVSAADLRALRQQPPVANDAPTEVLDVAPAPAVASVGRIRLSTGQVAALDRTVIIGRRPRSTRASGANLPHLIAVESPQQDISRSHLEVRPEGDTVVVIDLHTTNGSTLLRPGADPVRLHPGEQTLVLSGDVVDLGDGVTVAFEDLP
ncbi:FHA domain-containing protein [Microbacterium sp.]|uniref:FHA domain-containing protein n=1 Tax=Microbacterium sp. TaxID=51671 RepID=UPI00262B6BE2|nr:FHA domain-containing protein [Microbacterium sp.]MCV0334313.1 FHA domain-containing protein [Microbacterium sp.]MCV0376139.1 FHA domain-containing protein [Microbacterium sp.]MCV0390061.1 FHA domain-containing protein [Microbacterium sp.]MCV0417796.1 FHA domain-containing protein [Microbacterium sp.]MCV0422536.1 FHA domain-containing protein [Microbacterium sp.]